MTEPRRNLQPVGPHTTIYRGIDPSNPFGERNPINPTYLLLVWYSMHSAHDSVTKGSIEYWGIPKTRKTCSMSSEPAEASIECYWRSSLPIRSTQSVNPTVSRLVSLLSDTQPFLGTYSAGFFDWEVHRNSLVHTVSLHWSLSTVRDIDSKKTELDTILNIIRVQRHQSFSWTSSCRSCFATLPSTD